MTSDNWDQILNDPAEWEEPQRAPRKKSERRQRGAVVSVRFTPDELADLQRRAEVAGLSMSAYLRRCAIGSNSAPAPALTTFEYGTALLRSWTVTALPEHVNRHHFDNSTPASFAVV